MNKSFLVAPKQEHKPAIATKEPVKQKAKVRVDIPVTQEQVKQGKVDISLMVTKFDMPSDFKDFIVKECDSSDRCLTLVTHIWNHESTKGTSDYAKLYNNPF